MSEAQGSTTTAASAPGEAHLPTAPAFFPHAVGGGLEGMHEPDFFVPEGEGAAGHAHQSLSPLSMNPLQGTLSRPPSMASMSLPPGQTLSRVGSLSNLQPWTAAPHPHPLYIQPVYLAPGFNMNQAQGQAMQYASAQQPFTGQFMGSAFAMPHGPGLLYDYGLQPMISSNDMSQKPMKKAKTRKSTDEESKKESKISKPAKQAKVAKTENGDAARSAKITRSKQPSSKYRGVSKCSKDGRWQARIRVKRQVTYLGRYVNEIDAARKYDEAARQHHGDKAILNFPNDDDKMVGRKQAAALLGSGDEGTSDEDDSVIDEASE